MTPPVIGLDRDGTINEDIGTYVTKPDQFKPIEGIPVLVPVPKKVIFIEQSNLIFL